MEKITKFLEKMVIWKVFSHKCCKIFAKWMVRQR
jgi:hypothetical protein